MRPDIPTTILVRYRSDVVAVAGPHRFHLAPQIELLDRDDPLRMLVTFMCAFAGRVHAREVAGPYTDDRAERYARCVLIDDDAFRHAAEASVDDESLANRFNVPVEQIQAKRDDLADTGPTI
jgi:hypothetical protein